MSRSIARGARRAHVALLFAALVLGGSASLAAASGLPAEIAALREKARRFHRELARERWEAATVPRAERREELFSRHRDLLSAATLVRIREARAAATDSADIHVLERLELDLARWTMLAGVAGIDDAIAERLATVSADVEDYPKPLTLAELDRWILQDTDSVRVVMLESARLGLWRERIDPLLERRRTTLDSLVVALGYDGYTEFSMRLRGADPEVVLGGLFGFLRATDTMYQMLSRELALAGKSMPPQRAARAAPRLSPADVRRLAWSDSWDRYVPTAPELAEEWASAPAAVDPARPLPVVERVIPPQGLEGRQVTVDEPGDVAVTIASFDAPADIRLAVPELGGMAAARAALRGAGEARQRNGTAESSPEWRDGGPELLAMTAAELSSGLLGSPEWYEARRRDDRASGRDTDITRLSDTNLARLLRWHLWNELRRVRTEIAGDLLIELIRHRAGTDYWMPYVFAPAGGDEREIIRQIRGFARGVDYTPAESYDALASTGDFLPGLDEARALALAAAVEEHLRKTIGPEWFVDGDLRREPVFATPDGLAAGTDAGIARVLAGADTLDFAPLLRRCERVFDWSERLLETAR
jgi:hypothetical protein